MGTDQLATTDTHTDVSDSGTLTVSDVDDIDFDSNIDVTDDADGTVTVDGQSSTDTTTDVSEDGSTVVSQVSDINFTTGGDVADDADGTVTVTISFDDGSSLTFGASDDITTRYDSGNDDYRWEDGQNTTDRLALDRSTGDLSLLTGNLVTSGGNITEVGGTSDASTGAIRLANGSAIATRNSSGNDDHTMTFTGTDTLDVSFSGTKRAQMDNSGNLDIEGTLNESATL